MSEKGLTDARKLYVRLRDAGEKGVHSFETRDITMNVSQRAKDIVSKGVGVSTARENVGKRPGARYWLADHAPDWAVAVRPNGAEAGGDSSPSSGATGLSITPAPEQVAIKQPVAVIRQQDGSWVEQPIEPGSVYDLSERAA